MSAAQQTHRGDCRSSSFRDREATETGTAPAVDVMGLGVEDAAEAKGECEWLVSVSAARRPRAAVGTSAEKSGPRAPGPPNESGEDTPTLPTGENGRDVCDWSRSACVSVLLVGRRCCSASACPGAPPPAPYSGEVTLTFMYA